MFFKRWFKQKPKIKENFHIPPVGSYESDPFKKYINPDRLEYLTQKIKNYQENELFTDQEQIDYYDLRLAELPEDIVERSVEVLRSNLSEEMKLHVFNLHRISPLHWVSEFFMHHGWGTAIRNLLRDEVCLDKDLPSEWGWDDYYTQLVEIAVGARKYKSEKI